MTLFAQTLSLKTGSPDEPAREVLHLSMPMHSGYLTRAGMITEPVPDDLADVRRDHLLWVRLTAGRDGYALDTDGDLK